MDHKEITQSEFYLTELGEKNLLDVCDNLIKINSALLYLRKKFKGDMDCLLIYLVVLLDDLSSAAAQEVRLDAGVSALSISEITGISRETVRRKIGFLVADGTLRRERKSYYHIANNEGLSPISIDSLESLKSIIQKL